MLTVLESINLSTEYLKNKGIESPRINAELLLAKILNCKRLDLYLSFDRPLNEDEIKLYREFLKRRSEFEPLQYIVGSVEFYGLKFKVNRSVLIPRQETEILVETILDCYKEQCGLRILDIGTGSGIIAVCLTKFLVDSKTFAIDLSREALEIAKGNAEMNSVKDRMEFAQFDILNDGEFPDKDFDIIVSNPPYISRNEFPDLQPELKIYEPREALTDEGDGFKFYEVIAFKAKSLLKNNGRLFFETGQNQAAKVEEIMKRENFSNINIRKDYLNIDRVIYGELK